MRSWHLEDRERGLTLVELLVTIIIAGIAFAALVPVFVSALQTTSSDNARTVALGVAQDKLERIRSLQYEDITLENLNSGTFATAHGLGNAATVPSGSGTKTYNVSYEVNPIVDSGLEQYKQVTVDVWWDGNPRPVKHTRLRTDIYRQYAGPGVFSIQVAPRSTTDPTRDMIVPGVDHIITISAYVDTAVVVKEVRFKVVAGNGSYSQSFKQTVGTSGIYVWSWSADAAPDGFYTISATAMSEAGYFGNTWKVVEQLETGAPPAPTDLTATAGNQSVTLDWEKPDAGDIDYYEIWRSENADLATASQLPTSDLEAIQYTDSSVVNETHYYYWVYAVDLVGNRSPASLPATATPTLLAGDQQAPTVPGSFTAAVQATSIMLSWTPSQDVPPPEPQAGLGGYEIFRSPDGVTFSYLDTVGALATSYSDNVGSESPQFWYQVRAVDASPNLNRSDFTAAVGPLKTPALPKTLTVYNDRTGAGKPCTVTVRAVGGLYYDQDGNTSLAPPSPAVSIDSKGGSAQWRNLPGDLAYTVTATYASGNPRTITQNAPPWAVRFQ